MISVVTWIVAYLPGAVHLGEPVPGAIATLAVACWASIFALSGDLRRMSRHGWRVIRTW
jgi:hypothetical protein